MNGRRRDSVYVPTKERILRAALRLFSVKGFRGTTMKDIARDAEITEGAIYRHFRSKEEIVEHLLERVSGEIRGIVMRKVLPKGSITDKAGALVESLLDYALEHPDCFRFLIVYHILGGDEERKRLPGELLLDIFRRAHEEGELGLHPEVAFSLVTGSVERIFVLRELGMVRAPREVLARELKRAVERALS